MSELITNPSETNNPFVYAGGDLKEAIERTREAEAYSLEAYTRRFNGDKEYAKRYIAAKMRRAGGR
jgi:hypothetical protein